MTKLLKYITGVLAVFLLILAFWGGWKTHSKFRPCPEVQRDTLYVYDTVVHFIPDTVPYYIVKKDTVIVNHYIPADVDTSAILADYYNFHYYSRDWYDINQSDTLIHIRLEDVISQNMPLDNNFSYRYYVPQTIINNSVTNVRYQSYLYAGLSVPLNDYKWSSFNVYLANRTFLVGAGYIPAYNGLNVTGAFKLAKFKR
jgi:hypothetical protein